jgi:hypothetical protein
VDLRHSVAQLDTDLLGNGKSTFIRNSKALTTQIPEVAFEGNPKTVWTEQRPQLRQDIQANPNPSLLIMPKCKPSEDIFDQPGLIVSMDDDGSLDHYGDGYEWAPIDEDGDSEDTAR